MQGTAGDKQEVRKVIFNFIGARIHLGGKRGGHVLFSDGKVKNGMRLKSVIFCIPKGKISTRVYSKKKESKYWNPKEWF